jgi:hypothetical protein
LVALGRGRLDVITGYALAAGANDAFVEKDIIELSKKMDRKYFKSLNLNIPYNVIWSALLTDMLS